MTAILYASSLQDWFFADDFWFLREAQNTSWSSWLSETVDFRDADPVPQFNQYRPLYLFAFRIEYTLFGLHAGPYHLINLITHLASVGVFWAIAWRLTRRAWPTSVCTLIFAMHFAYVDAIKWVANGNALMATLFYLLAFLLFMRSMDTPRRLHFAYFSSLVAFACALLLHASTGLLLLVLPAWYFLVHRKPGDALSPRSWLPFVPFVVITIPMAAVQLYVKTHYIGQEAYGIDTHIYTNYVTYMALSVYPTETGTLAVPLLAVPVLIVSLLALLRARSDRLPLFAAIWYFLSLAPFSTFTVGAFGRLLYLGGPPLALLMTSTALSYASLLPRGVSTPIGHRMRSPIFVSITLLVCMIAAFALQRVSEDSSWTAFHFSSTRTEAAANERLINGLRAEIGTVPPRGVLYVQNAPGNLVLWSDRRLSNMVGLYFGDINVRSVPLKQPPNWNAKQVREALRPQDRLYVVE